MLQKIVKRISGIMLNVFGFVAVSSVLTGCAWFLHQIELPKELDDRDQL